MIIHYKDGTQIEMKVAQVTRELEQKKTLVKAVKKAVTELNRYITNKDVESVSPTVHLMEINNILNTEEIEFITRS